MGQLKLIAPANVLPLKVGRAFRGNQRETKENDHAPDAIQPPYRLRPSALNSLKRTVSQRHPMLNSRYQRPYHARRKASRRLPISCWMIGHLLRVDSRFAQALLC